MARSPSMVSTTNSCGPVNSIATGNTSDSILFEAIRTLGNDLPCSLPKLNFRRTQRRSQWQDTIVETSPYDYSSQLSITQHRRYRSDTSWYSDLKPRPNWQRNRNVAPNAARSSAPLCAASDAIRYRSDTASVLLIECRPMPALLPHECCAKTHENIEATQVESARDLHRLISPSRSLTVDLSCVPGRSIKLKTHQSERNLAHGSEAKLERATTQETDGSRRTNQDEVRCRIRLAWYRQVRVRRRY
jgi:hypothetical protein